ncbi:hypothetical protein [Burkholderia cenocepacia]|uniref:hypothetical protein n=1 Tax=Burkholderia cenocepacia TaxID=95486 RepID=UPI000760B9DA|nr:hypothetical protein [Burkholderia cenocepacia]KWU23386.1 hypothetical protein AS149_36980 [Burkholderia cenocepacia]
MQKFSSFLGYVTFLTGVTIPLAHAFQQATIGDGLMDFLAIWGRVATFVYGASALTLAWRIAYGRLTRKQVAAAFEAAKAHYEASGARLVYITTEASLRYRTFELHDRFGRALRRGLHWEQIMNESASSATRQRIFHA